MTNIILGPDVTAPESLKQQLLEAFAAGDGVTVDAGTVRQVSSPCLQLLVAAVRRGAVLAPISPAFGETAGALDLVAALGLPLITSEIAHV